MFVQKLKLRENVITGYKKNRVEKGTPQKMLLHSFNIPSKDFINISILSFDIPYNV